MMKMTQEQSNVKWIILYSTILLVLLGGGIYYFSNLICRNRVEKAIASSSVNMMRLDSLLSLEITNRELLLDSVKYKAIEIKALQDRNLELMRLYNETKKLKETRRTLNEVTDGFQLFILEYNRKYEGAGE